jgi:hypothetical protein
VNRHCYLEIMGRLCEALRLERSKLWPDARILHYDNAPAYDMPSVWEVLTKTLITKLDHPIYSLVTHWTFKLIHIGNQWVASSMVCSPS